VSPLIFDERFRCRERARRQRGRWCGIERYQVCTSAAGIGRYSYKVNFTNYYRQISRAAAAAANTQYLHVSFGTLTDLYVQFYNSSGSMVGSRKFNSRENKTYDSLPVTEGQMYYIKVTPDSGSGTYGTYWITFNTSSTPPED
jgi:hypothetical protein